MSNWKEIATAQQHLDASLIKTFNYNQIFRQFCHMKAPYTLLRVTAVLTAKDDGSQALGRYQDGKVIPMEPYLRDPGKHKTLDDNYVKDWIQLANYQLLQSGANFGLDLQNLVYVLEKNTLLNTVDCSGPGAAQGPAVASFITDRVNDATPGNPYHNSVILLYRWGADPNNPAGQSCSSVDSPCLLLNQYQQTPFIVDGQTKPLVNNQLTHEFGHFMGLDHTFPNIANDLMGIADLGGNNPLCLALIDANLPNMPGITHADLVKAEQNARDIIKAWPYSYDQDDCGDTGVIPDEYAIGDTPIDLGTGFPLIFGHPACSGTWQIPVALHADDSASVAVNDTVRTNVMSYWICGAAAQRFSTDQVKRMEWVLQNIRSKLISRTVMVDESCAPPFNEWLPRTVLQLPDHWSLPNPEPDWQLIVNALPAKLKANRKLVEEIQLITNTVPAYRPWEQARLEEHLRTLAKAGQLTKLVPATSPLAQRCQARQIYRAVREVVPA